MPSPIEFKVPQYGQVVTVKGYCTVRKSSFGVYKDPETGWQIIHKPSGYSLTKAVPSHVNSYGKVLALVEALDTNFANEIAALNENGWQFQHTDYTKQIAKKLANFIRRFS